MPRKCTSNLPSLFILVSLFVSSFGYSQYHPDSWIADTGGGPSSSTNMSLASSIGSTSVGFSSVSPWNLENGFLHTPGLVDFDFEQGRGEWGFVPDKIPGFPFTAPQHWDTGGLLTLSPADKNTYGYFESGFHIPLLPDSLYAFSFAISSNMDNQRVIPRMRVRTALSDFQEGHIYDITSLENGEASPTTIPRIYPLFYHPSKIAATGGDRSLSAFFEIVQIGDPEDSIDAQIYLHYLRVDTLSPNELKAQEVMKDYTFDSDVENWSSKSWEGIPTPYTAPGYRYDGVGGRLALTVTDPTTNYGFWESSWSLSEIPADAGSLYRVSFSLSTDNAEPLTLPKIRLRVYSKNFQASSALVLEARGTGDLLPVTTQSRDYEVYFIPSPAAKTVKCAIDLISLNDPGNIVTKNGSSIFLERCLVERMEIPKH